MLSSSAFRRHSLGLVVMAALATAGLSVSAQATSNAADTAEMPLGFSTAKIDRSVDPRQDFYRYAAGGWLAQAEIPASDADIGAFSLLGHRLDAQLLALIQQAATGADAAKGTARQQVGDYFRAAMDDARRDAVGLEPLKADLAAIAGATTTPADWGRLAGMLVDGYGSSPLINAIAMPDAKDSSTYRLVLVPGSQLLEQDEYTLPEHQALRDRYRAYVAAMLRAVGDTPESAAAHADRILMIETRNASAVMSLMAMRDPAKTYNVMAFEEAQALVPALDLRVFLSTLGVDAPERVQVVDVNAMKALQGLLGDLPAEDIKLLLRWFLVASRASELGQPYRGLESEFSRERRGLATAPEADRVVTQQIAMQLYHPLSQLYVDAHFPESSRREITEMVGHIKEEFASRLRGNAWLDDATRTAALEKLARIDIQVGYPAAWVDFSPLDIRPDDHFGNVQRATRFAYRREMSRVGQAVLSDRFAVAGKTTPIAVNSAYNFTTNTIDITAAILQAPFFTAGGDPAANYCSIGGVIGHEITHGFDSLGRQYDPSGNLRNWWTPQANEQFKQRTDVLVEQYCEYEILPGVMHNGAMTVTENTADLGGITLAHAALQRHLASHPAAKAEVEGLGPDQRCFIAWTQTWAFKGRPERLRYLVSVDVHAIASVRAVAPLLHLDAFHTAFGTRPGDAMWRAPEKRVVIW
jgi:putative endopeptidase